jgi:hypothetical protein
MAELPFSWYGTFTIPRERLHEMAGKTLKRLVRGDLPLSREIFGDGSKRRLIPKLQREGWPLFMLAGKRSGFADELAAHARKVRKRHQRAVRGRRRSKTMASEAAAAEVKATT